MSESEKTSKLSKIGRKVGRIFLKLLLGLFILILLIIIAIQTPYVQNLIKDKAVVYLKKKLNTELSIGDLRINFPNNVRLQQIYLEDQDKDTLLYGGDIDVSIDLFGLLKNRVSISNVDLEDLTAKIKRELPDTSFNFQFIADAFAPANPAPPNPADTSSMDFSLRKLSMNNVHFVYKDVVTGSDIDVTIGENEIRADKTDLSTLDFDVPLVSLKNVHGYIRQSEPLVIAQIASVDTAKSDAGTTPQLNFKTIALEDIDLDYADSIGALYMKYQVGKLNAEIKKFDLANNTVSIDEIEFAYSLAQIKLNGSQQIDTGPGDNPTDTSAVPWKISAGTIRLDKINFDFDDNSQVAAGSGFDPAHIHGKNIGLELTDLYYRSDSISGQISDAAFSESQSDFTLQKLNTKFLYTDTRVELTDLLLQTPGSLLKRNAKMSYPSLEAIQKDPAAVAVSLDLDNSHLLLKDLYSFVPSLRGQPGFGAPSAVWYFNSRIDGTLANLNIQELEVKGLNNTRISVSGKLSNPTDIDRFAADLQISSLHTSRRDLLSLLPAGTIPDNIQIPAVLDLRGSIKGGLNNLVTNLRLQSSNGSASVKGSASRVNDASKAKYDLDLSTANLDLGSILKQDSVLGKISLAAHVKGTGYDPKSANAIVTGTIQSIEYNAYTYKDLTFDGSIADQMGNLKAAISDPNIDLNLLAKADLSKEFPSVNATLEIDSINTKALHLSSDSIIYHGDIAADFPSVNPDALEGKLQVTNSILVHNSDRFTIDSMAIVAGQRDSGRFITVNTPAMQASLEGQYQLTEMGDVFNSLLQPYFEMPQTGRKPSPFNFSLSLLIYDDPILKSLLPSIDRIDSVRLKSHFSSQNGIEASLSAPMIRLRSMEVSDLMLTAATEDALRIQLTAGAFQQGESFHVYQPAIHADIKDNNIDFGIKTKDEAGKVKYQFAGLIEQPETSSYRFALSADSLLLNYEPWTVDQKNQVLYGKNSLLVYDFVLSNDGQSIRIASQNSSSNSPIDVQFNAFKLCTITGCYQNDSSLVNGTLNGDVQLQNVLVQPTFTSKLNIDDLSFRKDTLGNLKLNVDNQTANTFNADIQLTGRENDVQIDGKYFVRPNNQSSLAMQADFRKLQLRTLEGLTNDFIRDSRGYLQGKLDVQGSLDKPSVNGNLGFENARFNLKMLNSYFSLDNEKMDFNADGIRFSNFTVLDSSGNKAVLNGTAYTQDYTTFRFDLSLRARDFQALNSTKTANALYYGKFIFDTDLKIKGTAEAPKVDGTLKVNDGTALTLVVPQRDPSVASREGIVRFVDKDATAEDSLFMASYDSLNYSDFAGMDIAVNISIAKEAAFTLVIDQANGDFLNIKGEANLSAGIDPSGKTTLTGIYQINEGAYQLTLNLLKRKFSIKPGSTITWQGSPTDANTDITAIYEAYTPPLDLVADLLGGDVSTLSRSQYRQKLPFEVYLNLDGALMKPEVSFDIVLPDDKNYTVNSDILQTVRTRLDQLRQEPSELNKQVFALLLLNRFVGENPFSSSAGGMTASSLARRSVSRLLTEQLNQLAADLIQGVNLSFDVKSEDDYLSGSRVQKTDLNVQLSKSLLNDRLTVTVGSNFELEGTTQKEQQSNIAGNVMVNYQLSKDGRYMLRAYRRNEYQGIIEGYIIETGVGFVITLDYNEFRQLFISKAKKKELREQRRKTREQSEAVKQEGEQ